MPAIVLAIVAFVGRILAAYTVIWIAKKALLVGLVVFVLPAVLKNVIHWGIDLAYQIISQIAPGLQQIDGAAMELWGVGAYLGQTMMLDSCLAVIMSGLTVRITMNMVPFLR